VRKETEGGTELVDLDRIAELVRRNDGALKVNELTAAEAKRMMEGEGGTRYTHHYPFEWILVVALLFGGATGIVIRHRRVEAQTASRERTLTERVAAAEQWIFNHDFSQQPQNGHRRPCSVA
jgi:hypothetical protein